MIDILQDYRWTRASKRNLQAAYQRYLDSSQQFRKNQAWMNGRNLQDLWQEIIQKKAELMKNTRNYKEVIRPKDH